MLNTKRQDEWREYIKNRAKGKQNITEKGIERIKAGGKKKLISAQRKLKRKYSLLPEKMISAQLGTLTNDWSSY